MFIDDAAAAYKSKNGMVRFTRAISFMTIEYLQNVNSIVHDNRMFAECSRSVHSIVGNKVKNREENPLLANELAFSSGKQGGKSSAR